MVFSDLPQSKLVMLIALKPHYRWLCLLNVWEHSWLMMNLTRMQSIGVVPIMVSWLAVRTFSKEFVLWQILSMQILSMQGHSCFYYVTILRYRECSINESWYLFVGYEGKKQTNTEWVSYTSFAHFLNCASSVLKSVWPPNIYTALHFGYTVQSGLWGDGWWAGGSGGYCGGR